MRLLSLLWVSQRISGGLQLALSIHWPWDLFLIGYASEEVDDIVVSGSSVYSGALYFGLITLTITRVYLPEEYWKDIK